MPADPYVILVHPDPTADGRFVALCPDIPGWSATGSSPGEASAIGAEIVRGIISERRANGRAIPQVNTRSVHVSVPEGKPPQAGEGASQTEAAEAPPAAPKSVPSLSESEGFQALAAVVADSRAHRNGERDDAAAPAVRPGSGRVLKSDRAGSSK